MKDKTGLIIALVGIAILAGAIIYQAKTENSALAFVIVGLLVNIVGVIIHLKRNAKK
jgi:glucose dehydrogenase